MKTPRALQSTPTTKLEALATKYAEVCTSSHLNDFERAAIVAGINSELLARDTTRQGLFRFASQSEQLQAVIESRKNEILSRVPSEHA